MVLGCKCRDYGFIDEHVNFEVWLWTEFKTGCNTHYPKKPPKIVVVWLHNMKLYTVHNAFFGCRPIVGHKLSVMIAWVIGNWDDVEESNSG